MQSSTALSPQLSWLYSSEQYSVHLLRISCSSVRHFPDLSWIVEDLPCFSEVRPSPADMLSCCCFCSGSLNLLALIPYPVLFCFLLKCHKLHCTTIFWGGWTAVTPACSLRTGAPTCFFTLSWLRPWSRDR